MQTRNTHKQFRHFTANKRQRSQALLHCDLRNGRQIEVRVM